MRHIRLLIGLIFLLAGTIAVGCPCGSQYRLDHRVDALLDKNAMIFTAEVVAQQESTGQICNQRLSRNGCFSAPFNEAQIQLEQTLMGVNTPQVLSYPQQANHCGLNLQPGQKILVYASIDESGRAQTDVCRVFGPTDNELELLKTRLGPNPGQAMGGVTPKQLVLEKTRDLWPKDLAPNIRKVRWGQINNDELPDLMALVSLRDNKGPGPYSLSIVPLIRVDGGFELYPPTLLKWCNDRAAGNIDHVTKGKVGITCYQGGGVSTLLKKEYQWSNDEFVATSDWQPFTVDRTSTADVNPIVQPVAASAAQLMKELNVDSASDEQIIHWVMEQLGVADSLRLQINETREIAELILQDFAPEQQAQWEPELKAKLNSDRIMTFVETELEGTTATRQYRRVATWLDSAPGRAIAPVWKNWTQYLRDTPAPPDSVSPERAEIYANISSQFVGARLFASHQLQLTYAPQLVSQGLLMSVEDLAAAQADIHAQAQLSNWREPVSQVLLPLVMADLSDDDIRTFFAFSSDFDVNDVFFWLGDAALITSKEAVSAAHSVIHKFVPNIGQEISARMEGGADAERSAMLALPTNELLDLANEILASGSADEELLSILREKFDETTTDSRALTTIARAYHAVGGGSRRDGSPLIAFDPETFAKAAELLRAVLESDPEYFDARLFLGWNQMQRGDFSSAQQAFKLAVAQRPSNGRLMLYRTVLAIASGDNIQAKELGIRTLTEASEKWAHSAFFQLVTFVVAPENANEIAPILEGFMNSQPPSGRPNVYYTQSMMENGLPTSVAAGQFARFELDELSPRQLEQYSLALSVHAAENLSADGKLSPKGVAMVNQATSLSSLDVMLDNLGRSWRGANAIPVLYASDIDISYRARTESNVLSNLARHNMRDEIRELVAQGANVNPNAREFGMAPLHAAAMNGHLELVNDLLGYGAKPNIKNFLSKTPAQLVQPDTPNSQAILRALEESIEP